MNLDDYVNICNQAEVSFLPPHPSLVKNVLMDVKPS